MTGSETREEERDEASAEGSAVSEVSSPTGEVGVGTGDEVAAGQAETSTVQSEDTPVEDPEGALAEEELPPLVAVLEAALFASAEPIPLKRLTRVLGAWTRKQVVAALAELGERQERESSGLRVVETAGGYQLRSCAEFAPWVRKFFMEKPPRLSRAVLETLAVVAYRQPATRGEVEAVRGVNCDAVLGTLTARGLIEVAGRRPSPGRPVEYATTQGFLELFSLRNLDELPPLPEPAALAKLIDQAEEALEAEATGEVEGEDAGSSEQEAAGHVVVLPADPISDRSAEERGDGSPEAADGASIGQPAEASGDEEIGAPVEDGSVRASTTPALGPPASASDEEASEAPGHTVNPEPSRQGPTVFRAAAAGAGGSTVGASEGRNTEHGSNDRAVAEDLEPGGNRVSASGGDSDLGGTGSGQR